MSTNRAISRTQDRRAWIPLGFLVGFLGLACLTLAAAGCGDSNGKAQVVKTTPAVNTTVTEPTVIPATTTESAAGEAKTLPATVTFDQAQDVYRSGNYHEAADLFGVYVRNRPSNPWGQYMLGMAEFRAGDTEAAEQAFKQALALDSTHLKSRFNLSRVYLQTDRPREALDQIEQALAVDSTVGEAFRLQGIAYGDLGQDDQAIDAYQRALVLDDHDAWSMNNLGLTYIREGQFEDALPPLARAVEIRPTAPVFQNNLGIALERSGHFRAAETAYGAALAADSAYPKAGVNLERVRGLTEDSLTGPVDLSGLAEDFVAQLKWWRDRSVRPEDSEIEAVPDTAVPDSTLPAPAVVDSSSADSGMGG